MRARIKELEQEALPEVLVKDYGGSVKYVEIGRGGGADRATFKDPELMRLWINDTRRIHPHRQLDVYESALRVDF